MKKYDVAIIGAGPGGYSAAINAARRGLSVVLIEKEGVGGICLNWGCIPSKILLKEAKLVSDIGGLQEKGIIEGNWQVNFSKLITYSRERVEFLRKGLQGLLVSNNVNFISGYASFLDKNRLNVQNTEGDNYTIEAQNIVISTGAKPKSLPALPLDGEKIITSKEAFTLKYFPSSIVIIGGGVVGCEMATLFSNLGASVTLLEYMRRLLPFPSIDEDISKILLNSFRQKGIDVKLSCKITGSYREANKVFVISENGERIESELVLVAIGNTANIQGLGLEIAGVETDKNGFIKVDPQTFRTNQKNIYAIGDAVSLPGIQHPALAHVASVEGELVAEVIFGGKASWTIDYDRIPLTIFTEPEIGVCGLTKDEAQKRFPDISEKIVEQSVLENYFGIARALEEMDGLDKIVVDLANFGKIIGVHIVGPFATERIHVWVEAMRAEESAHLMAHQVMAHPTFSEIFRELLLSLDGMAIHVPMSKQMKLKKLDRG